MSVSFLRIIQPLSQFLDLHTLIALRRVSPDLWKSCHLNNAVKVAKFETFSDIPEKFWNKKTKDEAYVESIGSYYTNDVNRFKNHFVIFDLMTQHLTVFSNKELFERARIGLEKHFNSRQRGKVIFRAKDGFCTYQTRKYWVFIVK